MIPFHHIAQIDKPVAPKSYNFTPPEEWASMQTLDVSVEMLVSDFCNCLFIEYIAIFYQCEFL